MPRLRLRRLLLSLVAFVFLAVLVINFRFRDAILSGSSGLEESQVTSVPAAGNGVHLQASATVKNQPELNIGSSSPSGTTNIRFYDGDIYDYRSQRPWFMRGGKTRPGVNQRTRIWSDETDGDKIVEQLMFSPANKPAKRSIDDNSILEEQMTNEEAPGGRKNKKIVLYFGRGGWNDLPMGRDVFQRDNCPVDTCELTTDTREAEKADAIFFKDRFAWPKHKRHPKQIWILFLLECPLHTQGFNGLGDVFNWTATYRHDSDLVAPYEKWVPYDPTLQGLPAMKNYAKGKTKMVAWFVSNCAAHNKRMQFARELSKHISVDIYGSCGPKRCPRNQASRCFEMLDKDYRFYLAFENSNCKDYITEKFFVNGLSRNVLPIVMGARPEDYERSSPQGSYIHTEQFPSAKELALYLHKLANNETAYNDYFRWKGTGEFINTFFWCRLCALLHAEPKTRVYPDIQKWWAGPGTCVKDTWSNANAKKGQKDITEDKTLSKS